MGHQTKAGEWRTVCKKEKELDRLQQCLVTVKLLQVEQIKDGPGGSPSKIFGLIPANPWLSLFTWSGSLSGLQTNHKDTGMAWTKQKHIISTLRELCLRSTARCPVGGVQYENGRGIDIIVICIASCRWQQWSCESIPVPQQHKRWALLSCMEMIMNESYRHGDGKSRLFGQRYSIAPKRHANIFWGGQIVDSLPCNSWLNKRRKQ